MLCHWHAHFDFVCAHMCVNLFVLEKVFSLLFYYRKRKQKLASASLTIWNSLKEYTETNYLYYFFVTLQAVLCFAEVFMRLCVNVCAVFVPVASPFHVVWWIMYRHGYLMWPLWSSAVNQVQYVFIFRTTSSPKFILISGHVLLLWALTKNVYNNQIPWLHVIICLSE